MNSKIVEIQTGNPHDDQRQSVLIDEAFERIMSHTIKGSEHEDLAMAAFDVVRHAFSPLKDIQFKTAVHHVLQSRRSSPLNHPTITDVIGATGGLLILQQNSVITWFHPSLSNYFERSCARWFPAGHLSMALACLNVLMSQAVPTDDDDHWDWARNSFFGYAACSWGRHLRACSPNQSLEDMALQYLGDEEQLRLGTAAAYALRPEDTAYGFDIGRGLTATHVCSIFGLTNLLRRLSRAELNKKALVTGQTPLGYASRMGHVDTVEYFLKQGADPNLDGAGGLTALHQAIESAHVSVVQTLLRSPTVKLTPRASGRNQTVSVLLSLLNLRSLEVLQLALARDDLDINENLDISEKDYTGRTVLWWLLYAPYDKHDLEFQEDALRLVVQHPKCDINAVDFRGRTYVMRFLDVRIQNIRLLKVLLENGADVNRVDDDGESAISHAVTIRYSIDVTSLLIRHGADLSIKNRWGESLTHRLVADIHDTQDLEYLDLVLERMPTLINAQDDRGRTPLHLALVYGKTQLAQELLARAADVNLLDNFG